MSERLQDHNGRARSFAALHIQPPADYSSYQREVAVQWRDEVEAALAAGQPTKPMWLRRNGEGSNELQACVDYIVPAADGEHYLGAINISSDGGHSEVQVLLPGEKSTDPPVVASCEPYDIESLGRAIELVETSVAAQG